MCLIVFAWKAHPRYPLIVGANRDEWRDRPAAPAQWWAGQAGLLAGRDLRAGGTWLGATRSGRFGAITNFRDPAERDSKAPSRGALLVDYLGGAEPARAYLTALASRAQQYNGFNLLLADMDADADALYYFGSREGVVAEVAPGVHTLSNHLLDEPWPKVRRATAALATGLSLQDEQQDMQQAIAEQLFAILSDTEGAPDEELPDTGVGLDWERKLAPILIRGAEYGTRCSTVLLRDAEGRSYFEERTRGADGGVSASVSFSF